MSRIALALTVLLLALAAPASAKEIGTVSLCGTGGCADVTDRATHVMLEGGPVTSAPRGGEPYFVVRIGVTDGKEIVHRFDMRWLPKSAVLRGADGVWMTAPKRMQAELVKLSRGLKPVAGQGEQGHRPAGGDVAAAGGRRAGGERGRGGRRRRRPERARDRRARGAGARARSAARAPPPSKVTGVAALPAVPAARSTGNPSGASGVLRSVGREPADDELIERARSGDAAAYGVLVRRYEQVAFRTAYAVCGDAAEAEDAAQEALVKAYAALPRFRRGAPWRPWLLRIVANEARNRRRAAGRRLHLAVRAARAEPDAVVPEREPDGPLVAALARLDAPQREIVVLRHLLDLSEAECAEVLGCRRGTVKSRLSRALARLRAELEAADA
jgi:RNA polymerase sigma factor (sigma-70 family)